jgi:hypothetical protein
MANTLVNTLDLPFWELLNQAPAASSALSAMTTLEDGTDRFIYYHTTQTLYRYDTYKDTWQQLALSPAAGNTVVDIKITGRRGFHGRVISATSSTVTIGGLRLQSLSGETMSIEYGTGQGQERTLTWVSDNVLESGVITGTATTNISDSTKKWRFNQWAGYTVGITFGTGATQYRRVVYNDATTLYVSDNNLLPHDPWGQQAFVTAAPYAVPVTTAGSQAHYTISSQTFSVNTNWTTTPDDTSFFTTRTGGVYLITSAAAAPFFNFYYYDVANDLWTQKTTPQGFMADALSADVALERTGRISAPYVTKVGTVSATTRTLADSGLALTADRYANHTVTITGGTGIGQKRRIVAHTPTTFYVTPVWDTAPDNTSTYEVTPNLDKLWAIIPSTTAFKGAGILQYDSVTDVWSNAETFDRGVAANITARLSNWTPVGVTSITRIAAGVVTVASSPVAAGTGYTIGDILTLSTGGAGAQVIVTNVASNGAITSVSLIHSGSTTGYTVSTSATTGGTGTSATISITAVGPTANVATASNHFFKPGDSVTIAGCATDTSFNATFAIIGPYAINAFSISAPSSTASPTAAASQGTTTLVDPSKAWTTNEHVGRIVTIAVSGINPTTQVSWITANTATTLTLASTITAAVNGTSKYWISDAKLFGTDDQSKTFGRGNNGWATSGSTTTLVDSTKSWIPGQWVGYFFKVEAGTGYGSSRIAITANDATTLTFATQTFTPDATTKYEIADSWGLVTTGTSTSLFTDTAHAWPVNLYAGKRIQFTSNANLGYQVQITSNTANTITLTSALASTPTANLAAYCILGIPARGAGTSLLWNWGATDTTKTGRYFYSVRGGATTGQIDIYDISTGKWIIAPHIRGLSELWTTGSVHAYDGADTIYLTRTASGAVVRVFAYNINTQQLQGIGTTTMLSGTPSTGNLMEVIKDASGNKFLYILQETGTQLTRALVW